MVDHGSISSGTRSFAALGCAAAKALMPTPPINLRRRRDVTRSTEVVLGSFVEDALLDIGMLHSGVRPLVGRGREISKG